MLQELLSIFRAGDPLKEMADDFARMLRLTLEMNRTAGRIYFGEPVESEAQMGIYKQDVQVNKLERHIRKRVVARLSISERPLDLPYCLLLMGLVKDVERLGDYAKNLCEVAEVFKGPLPADSITAAVGEMRRNVEEAFSASADIFADSDRDRALPLIRQGKETARRADELIVEIARSSHPADVTTALVLGVRYYKRIGGHVLNLLSAVVMPLHKVDYYDEDEVEPPPQP